MLLLTARFLIYCSIDTNRKFFNISRPRTYIPFYISEIIISVAYIFFLIKVYKNQELEMQQEEPTEIVVSAEEHENLALGLMPEHYK